MSSPLGLASALLLLVVLMSTSNVEAGVNSTTLQKTLIVHASIDGADVTSNSSSVLKFNKNSLTVSWMLNSTIPNLNTDSYKKVLVKMCFGAKSAVNRKWRKNDADLTKSKTCKTVIKSFPFTPGGASFDYMPPNDVPGAFYFIRAFVLNSSDASASAADNAIALGQTTNVNRTTNLFRYEAYTGRSLGIVIAIICFSIASYTLLIGFFVVERMMKKNA